MNMFRSRRFAIGAALSLGVTAGLFTASGIAQTVNEEEVEELGKFEVTGSRIKRLDTETVSPTVAITAAELEATGFTSIADALRALPFNSGQALTPTDSGNSFTPGVSTINLRGLGNNNTLVLINGRRAVPYAAPGFNGLQTVFDLNSIPDAAIESVEILKDGGSAIYGSDAVGGVINFKLRQDFSGVTTRVGVGNFFGTDGFYKEASVVVGAQSNKTSIFVAASAKEQEAVYARDLDYSKNSDKSNLANKAEAYYFAEGYEALGFTEDEYLYDPVVGWGLTDPASDGIFDQSSSRGYPGYVRVGGSNRTFASPTASPTVANSIAGINYYNFQQDAGLFPEYQNYSFYTSVRHDFNERLYGRVELSFTRTETLSDAAPTPADLGVENGLTAGEVLTIPAYNAYNPWGVDITSGRRRLVELGNRINDVTSDTPRLLAALGGSLDVAPMFEDWTWESGFLYAKNTVTNLNRGSVADYKLQQALNGLTQLGDGSYTWDPSTPQADRTYFNWFGLNDAEMAKFLEIENPTTASLEYETVDVQAGGTVLDLPGGRLGLSVGAEQRHEKLSDVQTDLNATGNIVGGSSGTSSFGDRTVKSVYAEAVVPVIKQVEFQLAGRFEKYSDKDFDEKVRPKVGVKVRPLDWLILRASYSESFKAPDLAYLYTSSSTSFSNEQIADPVTGTEIDQLQIRTAGDPTLKPESTDIYYVGITLDLPGVLDGMEISFDWFRYEQTDLLAQLSDFYGYDEYLIRAAAGDPLFAGKVVRDANTDEVLYINDSYANISEGLYQGFDAQISYQWTTATLGRFYASLAGTYVNSVEIDKDEIVGSWLTPRFNANAVLSWSRGDWGANLYGVYRGERERDVFLGTGYTDDDAVYVHYTIEPEYLLNASVSYAGLYDTKIVLGVNNLLDRDPPEDPMEPIGTTAGVNSAEPAFWYLELERSF